MARQLFRSRRNRMISGVAGGIAEYFDIDPVIIRALFIITTFAWGTSILVYIILWIIVPDESKVYAFNVNQPPPPMQEQPTAMDTEEIHKKKENRRFTGGIILIIIGTLLFLDNIVTMSVFGHLWPIALIALGIYILIKNNNNQTREVK